MGNVGYPKQIFIGGSGRSGTTLLSAILAGHSEILVMPFEARFIIDPNGIIDLVDALSDNWSPYLADDAIYEFERLMKHQICHGFWKRKLKRFLGMLALLTRRRWDLNIQYLWYDIGPAFGQSFYIETVDQFLRSLYQARYDGRWAGASTGRRSLFLGPWFSRPEIVHLASEFIDQLFSRVMAEQGKSHWCDDSPFNALHANFLLELFPEMRFLYVYRNSYDVVCSYLNQKWSPPTVEQAALWLRHILSRWEVIKPGLPSEVYLEVRFEDLIRYPTDQTRKICEFLGITFEPVMLDIDLSRHNIDRWKHELGHKDLVTVEKCLTEFIT